MWAQGNNKTRPEKIGRTRLSTKVQKEQSERRLKAKKTSSGKGRHSTSQLKDQELENEEFQGPRTKNKYSEESVKHIHLLVHRLKVIVCVEFFSTSLALTRCCQSKEKR